MGLGSFSFHFSLDSHLKSVQAQGRAHYASLPLFKNFNGIWAVDYTMHNTYSNGLQKLVTIYGERWGIRNIRQATSLPLLVFSSLQPVRQYSSHQQYKTQFRNGRGYLSPEQFPGSGYLRILVIEICAI